ncbi:MAG: DUF2693 domain-containing protein [Asgard group archaeon]|nr:DUF2693 domain-containing protein [Asgard group archaeon]
MAEPLQFDPEVIQNAIQLWHKLSSEDQTTVRFTKKDGNIRIMTCTLNFEKIPQIDRPKKLNLPKILKLMQNSGILHVYDLEKRGWRSVPFNRVEYIEAGNRRYKVQPIKRLGTDYDRNKL